MLLSAHEVRYFCAWAHGARRSAHGAWPTVGNVGFSTRNQKHFLSTHGSSSLRTNQNWQNIIFVSAQKSWLCYLDLRISKVLHLLSFRRDNFSTKIWNFFWGILLAQICPAHGARRTRMLLFGSLQLGPPKAHLWIYKIEGNICKLITFYILNNVLLSSKTDAVAH